MKIGLDLRMAGTSYGIGRYSFELARSIIALDRQNSYVLFVRDQAPVVEAGFAIHANVQVVVADFPHYSVAEQVWFCRLLNEHELDLVHFMNFNVPIIYSRPYVVTIHDVVHHRLPGNKPSHVLHRAAYRYAIAAAARRSRRIVTVSNFSKREIAEVLRVPEQKITVVYEAATPVAVSDVDVASARQKFGLTRPYIIFVGVMERKKNIVNLAKGFEILRERYEMNIQLAMVGSADRWYPEVVEQAQGIKFAKDLVFTGRVSDADKYSLLKGSQAFVSASLYEGFGLPGLEAMSLGIPLAVANTEVFNEVYDNGAVYFDGTDPSDIANKVNLLLSDQRYSAQVAGNGIARAKLFSWARAAAETVAIYQSAGGAA